MNKPQSARKPRGRGSKRNKGGSNTGRGDNRVKGNPKQAQDKYKSLGRDALQSGDRILAEYYFQHADHYQRVINERYGVPSADTDHHEKGESQRAEKEAESETAQLQSSEKDEKPKRRRPPLRKKPKSEAQEPVQGDLISQPDQPDSENAVAAEVKPRPRRPKDVSSSAETDNVTESAAE